MKKLLVLAMCLYGIAANAVAYHGFESWTDFTYEFNRAFGPLGLKYQLGSFLSEVRTAVGVWDFSLTGGHRVDDAGVGSRGNADHYTGITLPQNSAIRNVVFWVAEELQPVSAKLSFRSIAAQDLKAFATRATWAQNSLVQGIPDNTVGNMIKTNSMHRINAVLTSADATAGKVYIYVDYITRY